MHIKTRSMPGQLHAIVIALAVVTAKADASVRGHAHQHVDQQDTRRRSTTTNTVSSFFEPSKDPFTSVLPRESLPQFILLTFDDAVTPQAIDLFRDSLDGVKSKQDGQCPIAATWYVSIAAANDAAPLAQCDLITGLRKGKHEIATHTYGHTANPTEDDIIRAADFLNETCGVPREEIRGFRTPNLGFTQDTFDRLHKLGFLYDSSVSDHGLGSNMGTSWIWPYTMDNGIAQDCVSSAGSCDPTKANPGLWEVPMWRMYDSTDTAMIVMDWPGDAHATLSQNFQRRYDGNRAPLGIYLHSGWLATHGQELRQWATEVLDTYDDVHFVTNYELLQWMSNPVPASEFQGRDCSDVVTDCFPPSAVEGRCGHGYYDADKCECICTHPWGGEKCLTQISYTWTQKPSPAPTSSPTTSHPTISAGPTLAPSSPTTQQPSAGEPALATAIPTGAPDSFSSEQENSTTPGAEQENATTPGVIAASQQARTSAGTAGTAYASLVQLLAIVTGTAVLLGL